MIPKLLAFDTATEYLSIALSAHGEVYFHEAPGGARASTTLIPGILALLARAALAPRDLDAIAFGRGPGAFTGLRTACSVAQGLAYGASKPVLPIDTLLAVAEDARGGRVGERTVWVAMDARMDEVYAAQYGYDGECWKSIVLPMLTSPEALNARWHDERPEEVAGNALAAFGERLAIGSARTVPHALPRAGAMLPLALALWNAGGAVDPALALPLYLRDKVAQTTRERELVRAAKQAREVS